MANCRSVRLSWSACDAARPDCPRFCAGAEAVEVVARDNGFSWADCTGRTVCSAARYLHRALLPAHPWPDACRRPRTLFLRSILGDMDLHLFSEGSHWRLADGLVRPWTEIAGVTGVRFAVWAPNARRVSVIGDFNTGMGGVTHAAAAFRRRVGIVHSSSWRGRALQI